MPSYVYSEVYVETVGDPEEEPQPSPPPIRPTQQPRENIDRNYPYYVVLNEALASPGVYFGRVGVESRFRAPHGWGRLPPWNGKPSIKGFHNCREAFDYFKVNKARCTTCTTWLC